MTAFRENEEYYCLLREIEEIRGFPWQKAWTDFYTCNQKFDEIMSYYHRKPWWVRLKLDKKLDRYRARIDVYVKIWGDEIIELYSEYKDSIETPPCPKDRQDEGDELLEDVPIMEFEELEFEELLDSGKELKNEKDATQNGGDYDFHLNDIPILDIGCIECDVIDTEDDFSETKENPQGSDSGGSETLREETVEEAISENSPIHVKQPEEILASKREAKVNAIAKWYEEKIKNWHLDDS